MADKLKEYKDKRDFQKTDEPSGAGRARSARLRFCVQYHEATRDHYDFRLERGGVLLSWAVPKGPSFDPTDKRLAIRVEDHPTDYAGFEGTIPKGQYGGGTVMLWDEGTYTPVFDFEEGLAKGALKFELFGERLRGVWNLVRSTREEKQDMWFLIKHSDKFATSGAGIGEFVTSVKTGRTAEEIARGDNPKKGARGKSSKKTARAARNPFGSAEAQLALPAASVPEGDGWVFEVKYDGMRALAFIEDGRARLVSRNGNDMTSRFENVARALEKQFGNRAAVLDGEIAASDEAGRTDFGKLQRMLRGGGGTASYMVFDLLALDGGDVRAQPLEKRKELLRVALAGSSGVVRESGWVVGRGRESFDAVRALGMEGVVGKRLGSAYGEKGAWIKIKCVSRQEFVVCGYSSARGHVMSSLLLGVYENGKLKYAGRVGTGFSETDREELAQTLSGIGSDDCPFEKPVKAAKDEKLHWAKPELLAEVKFAEWTDGGVLRHASFVGLRGDKPARSVAREAAFGEDVAVASPERGDIFAFGRRDGDATVCGVKLSHPDRSIGAGKGVTKLDAAKYYERAAERMLPHIRGRLLSVVRCHGDGKPTFFKKHPTEKRSGIVTVDVDGGEYFYADDARGLIGEVQAGTVEFHTWGSLARQPDKPDTMVFDLDPDEGMPLSRVRRGALDLKFVLEELSLTPFLKTSGGKGYHIVVPFLPTVGWAEFKAFARGVAELMETRFPALYTANSRKAARRGRIYIDWARNGRGATSVAPYSLRARSGGGVSVPISWAELTEVAPDGIDVEGALARLNAPDPWADYEKARGSLKASAK